jgi:hypothetical protein
MSPRCPAEPISWLRLERYHLGDIRGDERKAIADHLVACEACAACLARIEQDEAVALPALPTLPAPLRGVLVRWPARTAAIVGTLAAAAAVILAVRGTGRPVDGGGPVASGNRVKGDAIAFTLVRDDGARIEGTAGAYRDGDRFKALVTCAPGAGLAFDLVVYDASGVSFPLVPSGVMGCGNDVPMSGALRLTGRGEETVCLVWSDAGAVSRAEVRTGVGALHAGDQEMCKTLKAAEEP